MPPSVIARKVANQRSLAKFAEKHADIVVLWSGITHFFEGQVFFHEQIGFPVSLPTGFAPMDEPEGSQNVPSSLRPAPLTVLHMPTNPAAKGSAEIRAIVSQLHAEGLDFAFEEVTGVPHHHVFQMLRRSDIVIDQIFSDSAAGVFAMEASLLGIPVIVAGDDPNWFVETLAADLPATKFVGTEEVKETLRELILSPHKRKALGDAAKSHFTPRTAPIEVVRRLLMQLRGSSEIPFFFAKTLTAPRGGFATSSEISEQVTLQVRRYGARGLALRHNPELQKEVLDYYLLND